MQNILTRSTQKLFSKINFFQFIRNSSFVFSSKRCYTFSYKNRRAVTYFTEEQNMLRESVRSFSMDEINPILKKMDEEQKIDEDLVEKLFKQGFMGIEISREDGGCGMSFTDCLIVIEEMAKVDPAVSALVDIHNTLINRSFMMYGTTEQKSMYLPRCAQEIVGAFCLSESESGSDAFSLKTLATRNEENTGWIINGAKQWTSNASEADVFIVFATINPELKHKGLMAFIVESNTPGLKVSKKINKLGIRASSTCEVLLKNVFVSDSMVLGEPHKGYKIAMDLINNGRIGIAAQMVGLAQGAFNYAMMYLHQRKQFGEILANFQGIKFQYAELAANIEAARVLTYNAAALSEQNLSFSKEASIAKLYASTIAEKVSSKCIEFMGGNGFCTDFPLEKYYRDAKIGSIYEGTNNMQLETIAKCIEKDYK